MFTVLIGSGTRILVLIKTSHKLSNFLHGILLSFYILKAQGVVSYLGMTIKPVHDDL